MNNIFNYATKELSQDAFLCWSINWLNESICGPLYGYGKDILDLFLGKEKQDKYYDVQVYRQYEKIDVLVMFKDGKGNSHALIIEDKTNTSEHHNQMLRYEKKLLEKIPVDEKFKAYENAKVHLAYVKTGIMYDIDERMVEKANVINLEMLLKIVSTYAELDISEIISLFAEYLQGIKNDRNNIEKQIENGVFDSALQSYYGQSRRKTDLLC